MDQIGLNYVPPSTAPRLRQPDWLGPILSAPSERLAYHLYGEAVHPAEEQGQAVAWMKATGHAARLEECQFVASFGIGLGSRGPRQVRLISEINPKHFGPAVSKHIRYHQADPALPGWRIALALAALEAGRAALARATYPEIVHDVEWPMYEGPQSVHLVRAAQRQVILDGLCTTMMRPEVTGKTAIVKEMIEGFAMGQMVANQAVAMAIVKSSTYDPIAMVDLLLSLHEPLILQALKSTIELTLAEMKIAAAPIPSPLVSRLARLS